MKKEKLPTEFIKQLKNYVALKSISTDPAFKDEIRKTVDFLKKYFLENGATVKIFQKGKTNPVLFASFLIDKKLPTILIYGHYDVQPAPPYGWFSGDPFKLFEKNGRLFGRGVVDNKGQNFIHAFTISELFKQGKLKYNVKFLLEGNEESGNFDLPNILKKEKRLLTCDCVIVSDGEIAGSNPIMESSLRGGANIKINLKTSKTDLHSGIFGGATPSASAELVLLLVKLRDKNGKINISEFYRDLPKISRDILLNNKKLLGVANPLETSKTKSLLKNIRYDFYTQTGLLPTIEITGIKTGYTGQGFANILPAESEARINIRTVPPQQNKKIIESLVRFLKQNTPKYVDLKIKVDDHGDGVILDAENPFGKKVAEKLKIAYKKDPLRKYVGGSIPILKDLKTILKIPVISVSLGNDDCNMHGVNENFKIDLIQKALVFSRKFFGGEF